MPVLVSNPNHTDCEVCDGHASIPGMPNLLPKTPEEHAETCCRPDVVAAREEFEARAEAALDRPMGSPVEDEEEMTAEERTERAREVRARQERIARRREEQAREARKPKARIAQAKRRLKAERYNAKARIARLRVRLLGVKPTCSGDEGMAWFGGDDPVVTDLFTETQSPSRWDTLRARFRR